MTSSTDDRRAASSVLRGISNGTCASARVRFARTMRCATVDSGTRKARAISGVVSPPSRRRVSATRASVESTGWQEMNTRRSRSSPTGLSSAASRSGAAPSCRASSSCPSASCFRSSRLSRGRASIARCFAVAMSQAPGLSGIPDSGQRSSAATRASCARSSARPTSRTIRVRPAIKRADSIRQTASIARWASLLRRPPGTEAPDRSFLGSQAHLAKPLHRLAVPEVVQLEQLADFDFGFRVLAHGIGKTPRPFDRLFPGLDLNEGVAGDELLRLGERSVDHAALPARVSDEPALRARLQTRSVEQRPRPLQLLVLLRHRREHRLFRHGTTFRVLRRPDDDHVPHCRRSSLLLLDSPLGGLFTQPLLLGSELGRHVVAEVVRFEHLANLHLALLERGALQPRNRFVLRLDLPQPEPCDQLLGLGERTVDHRALLAGEPDASTLGARVEPLAREHHAGLDQLFVELRHFREDLGTRENARLRFLVRLHDYHEPHRPLLPVVL